MALRHKIPTIFSIYMVDVLCCALGCVILLWQVNYQEAQTQTAEAVKQTAEAHARGDALQESLDKLKNARLSIEGLHAELDNYKIANANLKSNLDASKKKEVQVTLLLDQADKRANEAEKLALVRKKDYDALRETHELAQAALDKVRIQFKDLEAKSNLSGAELAEKLKTNAALLAKLDELEKVAKTLGKENLAILAKLKTAGLRVSILEDELGRSQAEGTEAQKKLADLNMRVTISAKEMALLQAAMSKLNAESLEAMRNAAKIRAAAENRFAGITLTGKKIVFLVDMSGSMELSDENTADPDKWPLVCDTVARILQSLADVTHYQVILFSDKVRYPLGNEGKWLTVNDQAKDAKAIAEQLKQTKPQGPTNMYAAFEEAFRFRVQGLDTIYVLSDGLPNVGPGLPQNSAKLDEQAISNILSKHVRAKLKNDWNNQLPILPKVRINTIGFFYESPDVGAFLWALAREHSGSFVGLR